jgi:hypothetical protein
LATSSSVEGMTNSNFCASKARQSQTLKPANSSDG